MTNILGEAGGGFVFGDDFIANGGIAEVTIAAKFGHATFEKSSKANDR
ncbi:MAG: hypothetical protein ACLR6J_11540 [Parabacteroides merdae]